MVSILAMKHQAYAGWQVWLPWMVEPTLHYALTVVSLFSLDYSHWGDTASKVKLKSI